MGKCIKIIAFLVIFLILTAPCYASEAEFDEFVKNAPDEFKDISIEEAVENISIESVLNRVIMALFGGFKKSFVIFLTLCGVVILYCVLKNISAENATMKNIMSATVPVTVIGITFTAIEGCLRNISKCIDSSNVFCSAAIPVILGLCISAGNSFSGAAFSAAVSFVSALLQKVSDILLLPLTVIFLSFSVMNNFSQNVNSISIDKQIKKFIKWVIGIFITIFSLSMSLQSFLSASSDSVLKRSVKSALGSFIPIVGGTLSSSVDSIFTIASNSKNMFSVFGIIIIIVIFLPTIAECLCYGLSLSAVKIFADFLNEPRCSGAVGSVADIFYILAGICATCVIMMILSFLILCININ